MSVEQKVEQYFICLSASLSPAASLSVLISVAVQAQPFLFLFSVAAFCRSGKTDKSRRRDVILYIMKVQENIQFSLSFYKTLKDFTIENA